MNYDALFQIMVEMMKAPNESVLNILAMELKNAIIEAVNENCYGNKKYCIDWKVVDTMQVRFYTSGRVVVITMSDEDNEVTTITWYLSTTTVRIRGDISYTVSEIIKAFGFYKHWFEVEQQAQK